MAGAWLLMLCVAGMSGGVADGTARRHLPEDDDVFANFGNAVLVGPAPPRPDVSTRINSKVMSNLAASPPKGPAKTHTFTSSVASFPTPPKDIADILTNLQILNILTTQDAHALAAQPKDALFDMPYQDSGTPPHQAAVYHMSASFPPLSELQYHQHFLDPDPAPEPAGPPPASPLALPPLHILPTQQETTGSSEHYLPTSSDFPHSSSDTAHSFPNPAHSSSSSAPSFSNPAHSSSNPAHSSSSSAHSSSSPVHSSSNPAHSSSSSAHSSSNPAHSSSNPDHSSPSPAHSSSNPAHSSFSPAHSPSGPIHFPSSPAHSASSPTQSLPSPAHSPFTPSHSSPSTAHSSLSPTHSFNPSHSIFDPIHSIPSPVPPTSTSQDDEDAPNSSNPPPGLDLSKIISQLTEYEMAGSATPSLAQLMALTHYWQWLKQQQLGGEPSQEMILASLLHHNQQHADQSFPLPPTETPYVPALHGPFADPEGPLPPAPQVLPPAPLEPSAEEVENLLPQADASAPSSSSGGLQGCVKTGGCALLAAAAVALGFTVAIATPVVLPALTVIGAGRRRRAAPGEDNVVLEYLKQNRAALLAAGVARVEAEVGRPVDPAMLQTLEEGDPHYLLPLLRQTLGGPTPWSPKLLRHICDAVVSPGMPPSEVTVITAQHCLLLAAARRL